MLALPGGKQDLFSYPVHSTVFELYQDAWKLIRNKASPFKMFWRNPALSPGGKTGKDVEQQQLGEADFAKTLAECGFPTDVPVKIAIVQEGS